LPVFKTGAFNRSATHPHKNSLHNVELFSNSQENFNASRLKTRYLLRYSNYFFIGYPLVRVRFAPSPTGLLHIGNARAALINWLFAQKNKGSFMLRIDDTDLERSEERFEKAIYEDLAWLGLTHDVFAKQSERFPRYVEIMQALVASGRLYPCYETPEELDFKRKRSLAKGQPPIYDRTSLTLTEGQKKAFEAQGRKPHWRFKLNPTPIQWHDMVRGPVEFHGASLSDPVLIRADGAYLYTLCSVVDDLDFNITHIIRGEDHVTNTAVQIQLFEAIHGSPVNMTFGHTTLLMDAKGHALSKRLGSLSLGTMKEQGIEPMAINSLLARLGTSLPIEPFLSLTQLAETFDLGTFSRTPPHFDENDLVLLTHKVLSLTPYEQVAHRVNVSENVWNIIRGNIETLKDVEKWQEILQGTISIMPQDITYMTAAKDLLPNGPFTEETWKIWTTQVREATGRKGKELFMPLRQALTGMDHGPEMKDLLTLMPYELVIKRLEKAAAS
jgi:glutamyl-tRNA synthetase